MDSRLPSEIIRDRYGYMQKSEIQALNAVINDLPEWSMCVNIGAGFGTSGLAFIEKPHIAFLCTVDLYENMADNGLGSLEFERKVFKEFGYDIGARYLPVHMDSIEFGKTWQGGKMDMIFIDGDHTYEHCKGDIEVWFPIVKVGGVIAFHDYHEPNWPGVTQAIDELLMDKCDVITTAATFIALRKRDGNKT